MPTKAQQPGASVRGKRPNISRAVRLLIRDAAKKLPELAHVRSDRILVVAGEARRASRATIRPMRCEGTGKRRNKVGDRRKPKVTFRGHAIYYVMTLRPLFFRQSTAEQRIETVIHELFHVSPGFDGTLATERRHGSLDKAGFERELRPLVKRYLACCSDDVIAGLAVNGDVLVRQWLEKPPNWYKRRQRREYTEAQTFLGPVRMITRQIRH